VADLPRHILSNSSIAMTNSPRSIQSSEAEQLLRPEDLALLLGCSTRTVRKMVAAGLLPVPHRFGRMARWRRGQVNDWLAERAVADAPECAREVRP
jgi:excisionase family DNA binding protein